MQNQKIAIVPSSSEIGGFLTKIPFHSEFSNLASSLKGIESWYFARDRMAGPCEVPGTLKLTAEKLFFTINCIRCRNSKGQEKVLIYNSCDPHTNATDFVSASYTHSESQS